MQIRCFLCKLVMTSTNLHRNTESVGKIKHRKRNTPKFEQKELTSKTLNKISVFVFYFFFEFGLHLSVFISKSNIWFLSVNIHQKIYLFSFSVKCILLHLFFYKHSAMDTVVDRSKKHVFRSVSSLKVRKSKKIGNYVRNITR